MTSRRAWASRKRVQFTPEEESLAVLMHGGFQPEVDEPRSEESEDGSPPPDSSSHD